MELRSTWRGIFLTKVIRDDAIMLCGNHSERFIPVRLASTTDMKWELRL
jgi:hypothetical protein